MINFMPIYLRRCMKSDISKLPLDKIFPNNNVIKTNTVIVTDTESIAQKCSNEGCGFVEIYGSIVNYYCIEFMNKYQSIWFDEKLIVNFGDHLRSFKMVEPIIITSSNPI